MTEPSSAARDRMRNLRARAESEAPLLSAGFTKQRGVAVYLRRSDMSVVVMTSDGRIVWRGLPDPDATAIPE